MTVPNSLGQGVTTTVTIANLCTFIR